MQELLAQLLLVLRGAWRYRWPALALTWVLALAGWILAAAARMHGGGDRDRAEQLQQNGARGFHCSVLAIDYHAAGQYS